MPAPEQTPMVEEGLPQTTQEASTGPGMESETTATTILASVKEQVHSLFSEIQYRLWVNHCLLLHCWEKKALLLNIIASILALV